MRKKIAVIGAGATGLTAAFALSKNGHAVTVLEAEPHIGGLSSVHTINHTKLEDIYHHIFTSDVYVTQLAEELGLASSIQWKEPHDAFYVNKTLYPFTSPVDLLRFSHLPFPYRVTMGLLVLRARFIKKIPEDLNAAEWISRMAGKPVYEKVWKPLMESKFDADAGQVSAAWIWNKFKLRGSTRGKNIGKEMLGYMDGSFGRLYEALCAAITDRGGQIRLHTPVTGLAGCRDGWLVKHPNGTETYDQVLFTAAPALLAQCCQGITGPYRGLLTRIKYKANLCAVLALSKPLSPYYWTTVADRSIPFVAVIEHTRMIPPAAYGSHIVYLTRYLDGDDPLFHADDGAIRDLFLQGLKDMYPAFEPTDVTSFTLRRSRYAQPVIVKGYARLVPDYQTPLEGLYLSSMAQIYPEDRGQNYAIREGLRVAQQMHTQLGKER